MSQCKVCKCILHGEWLCGTCELEQLRQQVKILQMGLERVRIHHVDINKSAGRPVAQSRTIKICDEALECMKGSALQ